MIYKSILEQNEQFIKILKQNNDLMIILRLLEKFNVPNFYIVSGSLYQTVWNYYDNKPLNYNIKKIDIFYYDSNNRLLKYEQSLEDKISYFLKKLNIDYQLSIHNEARMIIWKMENENKNIDYYSCTEESINKLSITIQAIGITKVNDEIKVYAPYGLADVFKKTIRPTKQGSYTKENYYEKVSSLKDKFDNLNIIDW